MAVTVFKMTQISMTMLEGKIVRWLKKEGDPIEEGEPLLEVETDKVAVEVTAPASGYLRKIMAKDGDTVQVGTPVGLIAGKEDDLSLYLENPAPNAEIATAQAGEKAAEPENEGAGKRRISPLAKNIARELGVDIGGITGTGPGGLIVRADIEKAQAAQERSALPAPIQKQPDDKIEMGIEIVPLNGIRKRIAEHLTVSKKNAADVTTVLDVDMAKVSAFRTILPVSYTAFVVRAAAQALREFPVLNSSLVGEEIHIKKQINICVAVATETGLVTPVIPETDKKNVLTIGEEMDVLARKGRAGLLTPANFADGTFTVTNSGIFGSLFFTPIINYPQCAILGMGKVAKTPVVRGDEVVIAPMMYLCLTYDHRIVDGALAVKFLKQVKDFLEKPDQIIMVKSE